MKNKNISTLIMLGHMLFAVSLSAQQTVTLDSLIAQVLRANPGYRGSLLQRSAAEARVSQATAWSDPTIGVEFMGTPISSANLFGDAMERKYFVQQMIPFPGKKSIAADAAGAGIRFAEMNAAAYRRDLIAKVKKQYVMLFAAERRVAVNDESRQILERMIASVEARYAVAQASHADVLRLQNELAKLQNERAALEHDVRVPIAMLNMLRALPAETEVGKIGELHLQSFAYSLTTLTERALAQRSELKAMEAEREMNRLDLKMWERERLPDFMVGGAYRIAAGMEDMWDVMLGINLPIAPWASGKYSGKIEEQSVTVLRTEQLIAEMKNMITFEVYDAWIKAKAHWEIADRIQRTMIPAAEQTLRTLLTQYQTHRTDFLSLLDSFRMLNMYRMEYFMELADYSMHLADLERAVGEDLP